MPEITRPMVSSTVVPTNSVLAQCVLMLRTSINFSFFTAARTEEMLPPGPEFTITYPPWEFNEKMLKKLKLSIDKGGENAYNIPCSRELRLAEIEAWLSLVERCVRDAEAAGSNPVASTETKASDLHLVLFCFV